MLAPKWSWPPFGVDIPFFDGELGALHEVNFGYLERLYKACQREPLLKCSFNNLCVSLTYIMLSIIKKAER